MKGTHRGPGRNQSLGKPALCAGVLLALSIVPDTRAQDYTHEVMAQTGTAVISIGTYVSINNAGNVAFPGTDVTGSRIFVALAPGVPFPITFNGSSTRNYDGVGINNQSPPLVVTRDRFSGSPATTFLRKWEATSSQAFTVVGRSPTHFDSALAFVDINDADVVVGTGLVSGSTQVALFAGNREPPTLLASYPINVRLRPQIANDNRIVIRDASGIVLLSYPPGQSDVVAGPSTGFTMLGEAPGISQDGRVVAFIGNRGGAGESLFFSLEHNGVREVFAAPQLGPHPVTDLDETQRVGVTSMGRVRGGLQATLVFVGERRGRRGIHTLDVSVLEQSGAATPYVGQPRTVASVGDVIGNTSVSTLAISDPINGCGLVAYQVSGGGQSCVVRSRRNAITARVSIKLVAGPNNRPSPLWTTPNLLQNWMSDLNTIYQQAGLQLQLVEVVELPDPHVPVSWFNVPFADAGSLEAFAEREPCKHKWRTDAINVYLVNDIVTSINEPQVAGLCSFPGGSAPDQNDLIILEAPLGTSLGLAHEIGHYFNLEHTHANHEIAGVGCPCGALYGDCVADTRDDADPGRCPGNASCHANNLNALAQTNNYSLDEIFNLRYNVMSYHGPITTAQAILTCGQVARLHDAAGQWRAHVLTGAVLPTVTGVTPAGQPYDGRPHTITLIGSELPTTGHLEVSLSGSSTQATNPTPTQMTASFTQSVAPGIHCVCLRQNRQLMAFLPDGFSVTPSFTADIVGSPPSLVGEIRSSVPNQAMVQFIGPAMSPLPLPGFLYFIEVQPIVIVPFTTDANGRIGVVYSLGGLGSGQTTSIQTIEITQPSLRFSNAIHVRVP